MLQKAHEEIEKFPKLLIGHSACTQTFANVGDILISNGPSMTAGRMDQYKLVIAK